VGKRRSAAQMCNNKRRQSSFHLPACDDITFRLAALELFDKEWPVGTKKEIRLIGFGVTNFTSIEEREEPSLFPSELAVSMEKRERLSSVLDKLPPSIKLGTTI
jgi:hypothetical protein